MSFFHDFYTKTTDRAKGSYRKHNKSPIRTFATYTGDAIRGHLFLPGARRINNFDRLFFENISHLSRKTSVKSGLKGIGFGRVLTAPVAPLLGMAFISSEVDEKGMSGVATGMAREITSEAGAIAGATAGSMFGPIGSLVGMGVGGFMGMSVVDKVLNMSRQGRAWSIPDVGGTFADSTASATMRRRSLNAIRTSQFNVRSELGNEAFRLAGL